MQRVFCSQAGKGVVGRPVYESIVTGEIGMAVIGILVALALDDEKLTQVTA